MGWFHALADGDIPTTVYHICPKQEYESATSTYFPSKYDDEKFTRASHRPDKLVETANCFYLQSSDPDWVCLQIDTMPLRMQGIEVTMEDSEMDQDLKCPRIFGGLPKDCVSKVYPIVREKDGTFLFVQGLTDTCSSTGSKLHL